MSGIQLTIEVVKSNDCTGNCKSNYHTIKTTTAPKQSYEKNTTNKFPDQFEPPSTVGNTI